MSLSSSLSSSQSCWWMILGPLVPLGTAFLYAMSAAVFNHAWSETPGGFPWRPLSTRGLGMVVAASVAALLSWFSNHRHNNILLVVVWSVVTVVASIRSWTWLVETRQNVVVGGPSPVIFQHSIKSRVVVITGANTGIGKETARALVTAARESNTPLSVVLACRSVDKAEQAKQEILLGQNNNNKNNNVVNIVVVPLDLSDLNSVRSGATTVLQQFPVIDVLINNAGIMMKDHQLVTVRNNNKNDKDNNQQQHELVFQSNHLGHYLWTRLLLPALTKSNDPRIINVTSSTYTIAVATAMARYHKSSNKSKNNNNSSSTDEPQFLPLHDLSCTNGQRSYSLFGQYAVSKLANIYFTHELARRYSSTANATPSPFGTTIPTTTNNHNDNDNKDDQTITTADADNTTVATTTTLRESNDDDNNNNKTSAVANASTPIGTTRTPDSGTHHPTAIWCAAVHPGLVRTDVVRNMPWYLKYPNLAFAVLIATFQKMAAQGAWCTLHVATASRTELLQQQQQQQSLYWVNQKPQNLVQPLLDHWHVVEQEAKSLWDISAKYVDLPLHDK